MQKKKKIVLYRKDQLIHWKYWLSRYKFRTVNTLYKTSNAIDKDITGDNRTVKKV